MCNLYRMTKNVAEVAAWFDAVEAAQGANFAEEVYPGYPGLVVAEGAVRLDGELVSDPAMLVTLAQGAECKLSLGKKKHALIRR